MANVKFSKVELVNLQNKLKLFQKYLPTLQLKKILLQMEVNKAREEINQCEAFYKKEQEAVMHQAKLFTDPTISDFHESLEIEMLELGYDNIAGIDVPFLKEVKFKEPDNFLMYQPTWVDNGIAIFRNLRKAYQKVVIAIEKKRILDKELRMISIRVNLFEKRLIPELENDINRIRVFLGDQALQAVAQAKVSKEKLLQKKEALA